MKKIIVLTVGIFVFGLTTAYSADFTVPEGYQYTEGMAQTADTQDHGETQGDENQLEVGGFGNGYGIVNYYASGPEHADGSATAEVLSDGESFFYDNGMGGEAHSSNVVTGKVQTQGTLGQADFQSGAEQSNWVSIPGDLRFGYGYNSSSVENTGSIMEEGPLGAENTSTASGHTIVGFSEMNGVYTTNVETYGEAHNSNPDYQSNFNAQGGYGGGDTLINGNASVQGQFSGTFQAVNSSQNFISGGGTVELTNRYEEGVGNVVRSKVSSFSSAGESSQ